MAPARTVCPGPFSRRSLLQAGALGLSSFALPDLFRARAQAAPSAAGDTSVIFVWLPGGPPHMEMYDLKPDAPSDYRGEFRPVPSVVAGMDLCEHLPLHAKFADKFCIIRSVAHQHAGHGDGMKHFLTGREPGDPGNFITIHPMVGSIVAKVREQRKLGIPNYVQEADAGRENVDT